SPGATTCGASKPAKALSTGILPVNCQSKPQGGTPMISKVFLVCLLAAAMPAAQAATVFKCVHAQGKVTFTQQNCPENHALDDVVSARNQAPSGTSAPTKMAEPASRATAQPYPSTQRYTQQPTQQSGGGTSITVVGGSAERSPCSTGLS